MILEITYLQIRSVLKNKAHQYPNINFDFISIITILFLREVDSIQMNLVDQYIRQDESVSKCEFHGRLSKSK